MWMSMTGYGRGEAHGSDVIVTADVRSVNHRYLDIHVRCPSKFLSWEPRIRGAVRDALRRGKVDVFLGVREWGKTGTSVRVNKEALASFISEAHRIKEESGLPMDLAFRDLLGIPDMFVFVTEGVDAAEEHWDLASKALGGALSMLLASRRDEGERLREVVGKAVAGLGSVVDQIASYSVENKVLAIDKFKDRINLLSGETGMDAGRLHQEAAYLIDRLDITEEIDRLRSHMAGLGKLLGQPGEAVGKRFDFLVQETFRELSTASNKSAHAGISELAVTAKTELEKIREQIQNVE